MIFFPVIRGITLNILLKKSSILIPEYNSKKENCLVYLFFFSGQNDIGKRLAEDRGCIYIDPETLVQEEIEKNTKLGLLLEYSVRLDRTIHSDVVTKLLECRLRSPEVNHLGFVLAGIFYKYIFSNFIFSVLVLQIVIGFPMIPQQEVSDAGKAMITESTVFTVEQTLHELLETSIINSAIHKKAEMLLKKKIAEESARIEPGEDGPLGSEDKVGKANKAEGNSLIKVVKCIKNRNISRRSNWRRFTRNEETTFCRNDT